MIKRKLLITEDSLDLNKHREKLHTNHQIFENSTPNIYNFTGSKEKTSSLTLASYHDLVSQNLEEEM
jgi:hypothetical protein